MKRIVAFVLALALVGGVLAGCSSSGGKSDHLATVNGYVVSQEAMDQRLAILELFFKQPMKDDQTRAQMLEQLIRERLLREQADQMGIVIEDSEIEAEMAKFFGAVDRQYENREQVEAKLKELGLTNDMLAAFIKDFLIGEAVVERKMGEVTVSAEEMQTFYNEMKDDLYTFKEDVVRAAHVLVPLDQEEKAKEIAAKAKAGGDFAELAKLYSIDPGSGRVGGDLGYFVHATMVKEFADVAFALKVGEVSEPVKSQFGWHVIYLLDKQGPGVLPFAKAEPDVANRLLPEKQEQAVQQWLEELQAAAKITKSK